MDDHLPLFSRFKITDFYGTLNKYMAIPFFTAKKGSKILFVGSEASPFVKAGGLGEVMYSLPKKLNKLGFDARIMIPRYAGIDQSKFILKTEIKDLLIPTDTDSEEQPKNLVCNVKKYTRDSNIEDDPPTAYFLENMEYYEQRANVYGYADDAVRWALLSRGVLEFVRYSNWKPDIIVCADWQTGFLPNYLRTAYKDDKDLKNIKIIFSIHNLFYQGMFDHKFVAQTDFDDGHSPIGSLFNPRLLKLNGMKRGILYADVITTVSPTYAKEIMTPEYGELLDGLLREKRSRVYGILNGINYSVYNPETSLILSNNYSLSTLGERHENKLELQKRFGLKPGKNTFLLSIVLRLTSQKGFDILMPVMETLLRELDFQLFVQGSGEGNYMSFFQGLEKKFSGRVIANLVFDKEIPHLIYAAADSIIIPSKFEPSGLIQMEAMRYGCVPIVRKTGGLADSVEDFNPKTNEGTGFVFESFDPMAAVINITRANETYRNPKIWRILQTNCMKKDMSWERSAKEYAKVFQVVLASK